MKIKLINTILLLMILMFSACNQDFLDTSPATEFSDATVWSDPALVETHLNHIYFRLDEPLTDGRFKANLVDEADYRGNGGTKNFNTTNITQDGTSSWTISRYRQWADLYKSVRYCNLFFDNVDKVPFPETFVDGKTLKDRMTGEAHFLRAMFYFFLTSDFGGVPIIKEAYELEDEFKVPRNSYADCIDFIVDECDQAAGLLPIENTGVNKGRATKGAALALKSRALLYAASDLHNTNVFPQYSNPELLGYTSGNRSDRWKAAKDAAKAVMDLNIYKLYKADPSLADSIAKNLVDIFLSNYTEEDIFVKFFTTPMGQRAGLYSFPNGYHGWGVSAPIGNLVDDFEMKDGSKFDWNNPDHAKLPYANRDQRFYSSILYDGASFSVRPDDVKPYEPNNILQTGVFEVWDQSTNSKKEVWGVDTRKGPFETWNGSYTGYYLRKYLDPNTNPQYVRQSVTWRFFRYAEILLNYAEACIELGQDAEARTYLNLVRKRAGQPPLTESGDALRQRCRNERRIELCMEDHRVFDVRRWVIGPEAYTPATAAIVRYKLNPDHTTATIPEIKHQVFINRAWKEDKLYFLPIMRTEINKNDLLVQNPGY